MLKVAGSVALGCGKLPKSSFKAFKYPSFTVPFAYKSFSIVAAGLRGACYTNKFKGRSTRRQHCYQLVNAISFGFFFWIFFI
ncbi:hypothetical protein Hdeb2414_s0002g00072001 [Helianthus debilis subsp. tardiflorus]